MGFGGNIPHLSELVRLFATLGTIAQQTLCPWDSADKNTGVGCHALLQGILPTQGLNLCLFCLLHWQAGHRASMRARLVRNLPSMQETPVPFLDWEKSLGEGKGYSLPYYGLENSMDYIDLLEKKKAAHSSIMDWRIPWTI